MAIVKSVRDAAAILCICWASFGVAGHAGERDGFPAMGPPVPTVTYDGRWGPGSAAPFTENRASLLAPVYKTDTDSVSLSLAGGDYHLSDSLALDSGLQVPQDLYRFEVGAQFARLLPDKRSLSLRASLGYAGDRTLSDAGGITYGAMANYGFPGSERSYWVLSLYFSNNSPLINYIPLPGVSYVYRTEGFSCVLGFPVLSLRWTPVVPWSFSTAVFGPTIQSEAEYGSVERLQLFSGYYWNRQRYIPSARVNDGDRLTIEDMKVAAGLRTRVWTYMLGELQVGRSFDRSIYVGNGLTDSSGGWASVPADWYASWGVKARF